ncbi:MAG: hypothetical protein A3F99_00075 [Candidatus Colwellbacteria bacterium RIFCSPLOWO2_12_FULL_43_11]|uniref:histidine kinase n=1 Tax=Candidatus Colwellbacteria bacterium RIFCSPLOWO2_12_FULL_43_11 TaxID=1797693 RepID=A0A1G1ZAQ3_9BACT|nr:MAG: hypothetical protein A3F99_00075 [Candidatus Colwellbacteria bacterium RIFCSPLOWO2_12_FULL_43_11]
MNEPVKRKSNLSQLLVYVMVFVIILGMVVTVVTVVFRFANQGTVSNQVTGELNTLLDKVQVLVNESSSVECFNKDCTSESGNDLKLRFADSAKDPTCIFLENGSVRVAQGPGSDGNKGCTSESEPLTPTGVTVYSLTFTKVEDAQGGTTVKTDAALAYSARDTRIDIFLIIGLFVVGLFLIRSILSESKQKRLLAEVNKKLDSANADLKNLNEHLEQRVAEQTIEVRRAYEVEKTARIQLEELDRAKDQFVLSTQHNLRTPLTIIKGYLATMKDDSSISAESRATLERMAQAADTLSKFMNELLQITELNVMNKNKEAKDI